MAITWTNDLAVGDAEIDLQHKELFAAVNDLMEAIKGGKGDKVISQTIAFLEAYVVKHFDMEQKKMIKSNYPGYDKHKGEHEKFIKTFLAIKAEYEKNKTNPFLAIKLKAEVVDWILNHIEKEDKVMGKFVTKQ